MIKKIVFSTALVFLSIGPSLLFAETLDKQTALKRALENNPSYKEKLSEINAAEGERVQASLLPNPGAFFELENFAGTNDREGFERTELTVGLKQKIELAGKRRYRTDIAEAGLKIAREKALAGALGLLSETEYAFMRTAVANERLELAERRVQLAGETIEIVERRVNAAASPDVELLKAKIEKDEAEIEEHHVEEEYNIARNDLARLMGLKGGDDLTVDADLSLLPELIELETVTQLLESTPDARVRQLEKTKARSSLDLAKASGVPDPTVGLGVRQFFDNDDTALVAEFSIPIPVFDRNQGGVGSARAGVKRSEERARVTELALYQSAIQAWESFCASLDVAQRYQNSILPNANKAFGEAERGYNLGAFSYLDLLDAQRTLNKVQSEYLDNLLELYKAKAEIDFLMGTNKPLVQEISVNNEGGQNNE